MARCGDCAMPLRAVLTDDGTVLLPAPHPLQTGVGDTPPACDLDHTYTAAPSGRGENAGDCPDCGQRDVLSGRDLCGACDDVLHRTVEGLVHAQYFPTVDLPSGDRIFGAERSRRFMREAGANDLHAAVMVLRARAGGDAATGGGA